MERVVVHVTTLDQWKSVLDVWFKQGYLWFGGDDIYNEHYFRKYGSRQIGLKDSSEKYICCWVNNDYGGNSLIEYSEFMAQQKEDNQMKTYYVTQEQLNLIEELKNLPCPLVAIMGNDYGMITLYDELPLSDREWLRYLGGDETIEFKLKKPLYRLWRVDKDGDTVYMIINGCGTPSFSSNEYFAFTAPLEEIKKWKTPAWSVEEAK